MGIEARVQDLKEQHAEAVEKKHKMEALKEVAERAKNDAVRLLKEGWSIDTVEQAKALIGQKHRALEALLEEAEEQLKNA